MRTLVGTAALLLALFGCGDGDDNDAGDGPADGAPTCTDVAGGTATEESGDCPEDEEVAPEDDEPTEEPLDEAEPSQQSEEPAQETGDSGALPACGDVWIEGETLPADYDGCTHDGDEVLGVVISCKDGTELTFHMNPETGDELYYAVLGGEIMPSADEEARTSAYAACFG